MHDPVRLQRHTVFDILTEPGRKESFILPAPPPRSPHLTQPMGSARAFTPTNRKTPLSKPRFRSSRGQSTLLLPRPRRPPEDAGKTFPTPRRARSHTPAPQTSGRPNCSRHRGGSRAVRCTHGRQCYNLKSVFILVWFEF